MNEPIDNLPEIHAEPTIIVGDPAPLFKSLALAQGAFTTVVKSRHVNAGALQYDYATLADVLSAVTPALSANGLAIMQPPAFVNGRSKIRTMLVHESGAYIYSDSDTPMGDGWQKVGSGMTYARRYLLSSFLGVAPDEDDDGNAADGKPAQTVQRQEPPKPKAAPKQTQAKAPPVQSTQAPIVKPEQAQVAKDRSPVVCDRCGEEFLVHPDEVGAACVCGGTFRPKGATGPALKVVPAPTPEAPAPVEAPPVVQPVQPEPEPVRPIPITPVTRIDGPRTKETDSKLMKLFASLKMNRTEATALCQSLFGKDRATNEGEALAVVAALEAK